jgi:hypothetical protein
MSDEACVLSRVRGLGRPPLICSLGRVNTQYVTMVVAQLAKKKNTHPRG